MPRWSSIAIVVLLSGCSKWVAVEGPVPVQDTIPTVHWEKVRLSTSDGRVLVLRQATAEVDSIRGTLEPRDPAKGDTAISFAVPKRTVTRIEVRRTDPLKTTIFIGSLIGVAALMATFAPPPDLSGLTLCGLQADQSCRQP
jgi:hypothetical protein